MQSQHSPNTRAPLLSWDIFTIKYNALAADAEKYRQSLIGIKQIARANKWSAQQTKEAIENIQRYVIIITDPSQKIVFTGKGFYEMTGYTFDEATGRNPNFLQGPATSQTGKGLVKSKLIYNEPTEIVLENYRKNGELYHCKIMIKPVMDNRRQLVNYIAYELEIAA